jgi:hypothetical protein
MASTAQWAARRPLGAKVSKGFQGVNKGTRLKGVHKVVNRVLNGTQGTPKGTQEARTRLSNGRHDGRRRERRRGRRLGHGSCVLEMRLSRRMAQSVSGITAAEQIPVSDAGSRSWAAEGETATRNVENTTAGRDPQETPNLKAFTWRQCRSIFQERPCMRRCNSPTPVRQRSCSAQADLDSDKDLAAWMPRLWPCLTTLAAAHAARDLGIDL